MNLVSIIIGAALHSYSPVGDSAAQAFIDAGHGVEFISHPIAHVMVDLRRYSEITRVPQRISHLVGFARFEGCKKLTSVSGLPSNVRAVFCDGCTSLGNVQGLPRNTHTAWFKSCTSLTSVAGLPAGVHGPVFSGCTSLTTVDGLSAAVTSVDFDGCTSLQHAAGLPAGVKKAYFNYCTSLVRIEGLPQGIERAYFRNCTSIVDIRMLPATIISADFRGCRRLHRLPPRHRRSTRYGDGMWVGDMVDPADDVRRCMRAGVCDRLLERVGPDVTLLVGCFATAGFNSSPHFQDRMETHIQVLARYDFSALANE